MTHQTWLLLGMIAIQIFYLSPREVKALNEYYKPSPITQACTPEGGVSAESTDDNSTGDVIAPEAVWSASGTYSRNVL